MTLKGSLRQAEFDKLFLLHEFRVWAIVYDVGAENWRRQRGIDFLGIEILLFAVENKIVSVNTEITCNFLAEKDKCKDIPVLSTC